MLGVASVGRCPTERGCRVLRRRDHPTVPRTVDGRLAVATEGEDLILRELLRIFLENMHRALCVARSTQGNFPRTIGTIASKLLGMISSNLLGTVSSHILGIVASNSLEFPTSNFLEFLTSNCGKTTGSHLLKTVLVMDLLDAIPNKIAVVRIAPDDGARRGTAGAARVSTW